jgi:quercetin dioxygenase-like cupin family protein
MNRSRLADTDIVRATRPDKPAKHNLFETARFFADVWVLAPGQAQSAHRHATEDKLYQVLSGRGRVTSGAERHDVRAGHVVFCPAGDDHAVENPGPDDLRLLVFMAPHPKPPVA